MAGGAATIEIPSIKQVKNKHLFVCLVGRYVVLPGPAWCGMAMSHVTGRIKANVHIVPFGERVTDLKTRGLIAPDAQALVLLRGGDDEDGKQTGLTLCPGSGPTRMKEFNMLLQRAS